MPNQKNYWTARHGTDWQVKREGNKRATSVHPTQFQAWSETKNRAKAAEGEALLQNKQGRIRERNSYGNDPFPPKG